MESELQRDEVRNSREIAKNGNGNMAWGLQTTKSGKARAIRQISSEGRL